MHSQESTIACFSRSALLASIASIAALLTAGSAAHARTEVVTWSYVEPCSVDRFELRYGTAANALNQTVDAGRPRQAGGHFSYALDIPDQDDLHVCVAAIRGNQTSACSNQLSFGASSVGHPGSEPAPGEEFRNWCDDFTGGVSQQGWIHTGPDNSLVRSPQLFSEVNIGSGNHVLTTGATGNDVHSHFLGADEHGMPSPAWNRYEYSGQMMFSDAATGIGVTLYSRFNVQTGYYRLGRTANGNFELQRDQLDPTYNCVPGAAQPTVVSPDNWYQFRIRVSHKGLHTQFQTKVWPADRREPDGFQQRCTDSESSRQLSGAVGVWSSGPGQKYWDNLLVSEFSGPGASDPIGAPGKPELVP